MERFGQLPIFDPKPYQSGRPDKARLNLPFQWGLSPNELYLKLECDHHLSEVEVLALKSLQLVINEACDERVA